MFGRLTVLSRVVASGQARWLCLCECGEKNVVAGYDLRKGLTYSCGCARDERIAKLRATHRKTGTKEYFAWINVRNRCNRPDNNAFARYGGKGISVCREWQDSFETFFRDMGKCPKGYSLDRIDSTLGYSKANCRWASMSVQQNNKARCKTATLDGITKPLAIWCRELGLSQRTVRARVYELGWTTERALTTAIKKR